MHREDASRERLTLIEAMAEAIPLENCTVDRCVALAQNAP
jgi:hypothetical protein